MRAKLWTVVVVLAVVQFTIGCVSSVEYRTPLGSEKIRTDWLFIYYMPYDNNLSGYGETIIKKIGDNIKSKNVIATIQAEFADSIGMKRYILTNKGITVTSTDDDQSASIHTYQEYLKWVKEKVEYKKLAVVFLDHGGKLDEICLDEKPINQFLKIDDLKSALINILGKRSIDLLFLQVCTKGVMEALYEFKDTAKYTLCSQIELGAPNDYYQGLFSAFSKRTINTGYDVAELIVNHEKLRMYNSYTLVDNTKMDNVFSLFSDLIIETKNMNIQLSDKPFDIYYAHDRYWDIISFFEKMPETECKIRLMEFIKSELIVFHKISRLPFQPGIMKNHSGLSICGLMDNKYDKLEFYQLLQPIRELYRQYEEREL